MTAAAAVQSEARSSGSATERTPWTGAAFGLAVRAARPLSGVDPLADGVGAAGAVELRLEQAAALKEAVRGLAGTCLIDRRHPDGREMLRIARYEESGYAVAAPRHGRHLISLDGTLIRSALPRVPAWQWQRLLFSQVLPLAATLQGLEVLHASAVIMEGRAYGFVAPSGTGKTSLAVNLAARGAVLLTDDVLALDVSGRDITAYSGGRLVSVASRELSALDAEARLRVGTVLAETDKVHVRPSTGQGSAPLAALYFLRRDVRRRGVVEVRGGAGADTRLLLGARFITYLPEPQHVLSHLDVASRIASEVQTFVVDIPRDRSAADAASAVAGHAAKQFR